MTFIVGVLTHGVAFAMGRSSASEPQPEPPSREQKILDRAIEFNKAINPTGEPVIWTDEDKKAYKAIKARDREQEIAQEAANKKV